MPTPKSKPTKRSTRPARPGDGTPESEVLTLAEAARYLRVTEAEVIQLVQQQSLPGRQV